MFGFLKRDPNVDQPGVRGRVCDLLRAHGTLFLEAAFRHVSSDFYILATAEDVDRVLAWFAGRGGGKTPLLIHPARELAATARPAFEGNTSHEGWDRAMGVLAQERTLVIVVETLSAAPSYHLVEAEDDWATLRPRIPVGATVRAYKASDFRSRCSALTVWSGGAG